MSVDDSHVEADSARSAAAVPVAPSLQPQLQGVNVRPTWCDRLRPRTFEECLLHEQVNDELQALVQDARARNELPHIMLTGPAGCGKRTRASCLIAALYKIRRSELFKIFELLPHGGGENAFAPTLEEMLERINFVVRDGVEQHLGDEEQRSDARNIPVNVVLTRARTITCDKAKDGIQVLHSPVHVEMTPHDVNFCDTKIVQSTLKTLFESNEFDLLTLGAVPSLCRFQNITTAIATATASTTTAKGVAAAKKKEDEHVNPRFRIFVFNNVDKMSREAQTALRRIMEDYSALARFILIAVNIDHVIAPIQSRCHIVTVPRPQNGDVADVLQSALYRVVPKETLESEAFFSAMKPYVARLAEEADGNVTKALTVMHASLHSMIENHDALIGALRRFDIAQPDWLLSMRECVRQICQVSMKSSSTRHVYLKDTLSELLKRRVPTEYIVRYLDQHVRKTLREQGYLVLRSIQQLLDEPTTAPISMAIDGDERVNEEERRYLQRQLQSVKCQLAGVCSDVSTACAFYETRSTKSQYAVIHINALALCLVVIVGLYQNSLALTLDADKHLRVCRPYSAVYDLGRLLRHTMQRVGNNQGGSGVSTNGGKPVPLEEQITVAQQMKQMCLACNSLAGVDWKLVRQQAKDQNIDTSNVSSQR